MDNNKYSNPMDTHFLPSDHLRIPFSQLSNTLRNNSVIFSYHGHPYSPNILRNNSVIFSSMDIIFLSSAQPMESNFHTLVIHSEINLIFFIPWISIFSQVLILWISIYTSSNILRLKY